MKTLKAVISAVLLVSVGAGVADAQSLRINVYSQRDSRWANDKMGASGVSVGNYGCMMTCVAAAYRVTPGTLNTYLSRNRGYTSDGSLDHYVAARFDGTGGLRYVRRGNLPGNASSIGRGIRRGAVYLARSSRPLGFGQHWVLVFRVSRGRAYYMDPWDGTIRRVGDVESNNRVWVPYGAEARIYSFR